MIIESNPITKILDPFKKFGNLITQFSELPE